MREGAQFYQYHSTALYGLTDTVRWSIMFDRVVANRKTCLISCLFPLQTLPHFTQRVYYLFTILDNDVYVG